MDVACTTRMPCTCTLAPLVNLIAGRVELDSSCPRSSSQVFLEVVIEEVPSLHALHICIVTSLEHEVAVLLPFVLPQAKG